LPFTSRINSLLLGLGLLATVLISGCASDGNKDETDGWSEARLYSEATDKLKDNDFA
jgi:outer membrane protein assembly factor BamD